MDNKGQDGGALIRCMGGRFCSHTPGSCTATASGYGEPDRQSVKPDEQAREMIVTRLCALPDGLDPSEHLNAIVAAMLAFADLRLEEAAKVAREWKSALRPGSHDGPQPLQGAQGQDHPATARRHRRNPLANSIRGQSVKPDEQVAREMMRQFDIDPDVFAGMHGGYGHWLDTARAVIPIIRNAALEEAERAAEEGENGCRCVALIRALRASGGG